MTGEEERLRVVCSSHKSAPPLFQAKSLRHGAEKQTVPWATAGAASSQQGYPTLQSLEPAAEIACIW